MGEPVDVDPTTLSDRYSMEAANHTSPYTLHDNSSIFPASLDFGRTERYLDLSQHDKSTLHGSYSDYVVLNEKSSSSCEQNERMRTLSPELWPWVTGWSGESSISDQPEAGQCVPIQRVLPVTQNEEVFQGDASSPASVATSDILELQPWNSRSEYEAEESAALWFPRDYHISRGESLTHSIRHQQARIHQSTKMTGVPPTIGDHSTRNDSCFGDVQNTFPIARKTSRSMEGTRLRSVRTQPKIILPRSKNELGIEKIDSRNDQKRSKTLMWRRRPTEDSVQRHNCKDAFLLESKLAGMSYKQIKEEGQFVEAESTLRGRFRTLTKHKDLRVRKPEWQEGDVSRPTILMFLVTSG
ncbi:hypothetical protein MMC16_002251 [Acarospora aff. strigata]|nr:hypothetical protein [Acarospora aff. strigata]